MSSAPNRRKLLAGLGAIGLTSALAACGKIQPEAEFVMTASTTLATDHFQFRSFELFKKLVEERSNGRIEVRIFPNGVLGSDLESIRSLQFDSIQLATPASSPLATFIPKFFTLDIPYLFDEPKHAYSVLDGPFGQGLMKSLESDRIVGLGWWENGFRHLSTANTPVQSPDDARGLKIRVVESQTQIRAWNATGASATPMAFGEVYTALQQGTVDGQDNPLPLIASQRFYEVQNYIIRSAHVYSPTPLLMSKTYFDKLPANLQEIVTQAGIESTTFNREQSIADDAPAAKLMKEAGCTILDLPEKGREEFKSVMQGTAIPYVRRIVGDQTVDDLLEHVEAAQ